MSRNTSLSINCLVLILILFLQGCKKETVEPQKAVWLPVQNISDDSKIILNASSDGKQLFTYGPYNLDIIDSQLHTKTIAHLTNSLNIPPSNGIFTAYIYEDRNVLFFNSFRALKESRNGSQLGLANISPTAKSFHTSNQTRKYVWAINDQGQVLLSVRDQDDTYSIYLVSFNVSEGNQAVGLPRSVKRIGIAPLINPPTSFFVFEDRFFFSCFENGRGILYTIGTNGDVLATNRAFDPELFFYKNALYLVQGSEILLSRDGGLSFNERQNYNQDLRSYYFRVINNKILVFNRAGLGVFEFGSNGFQIKALDMEGLDGNHITQLTFFNDKLFVSTLTGLFYKSWQDVFM